MSDEYNDDDELYGLNPGEEEDNGEAVEGGFGSMLVDLTDDTVRHQLRGMFQNDLDAVVAAHRLTAARHLQHTSHPLQLRTENDARHVSHMRRHGVLVHDGRHLLLAQRPRQHILDE